MQQSSFGRRRPSNDILDIARRVAVDMDRRFQLDDLSRMFTIIVTCLSVRCILSCCLKRYMSKESSYIDNKSSEFLEGLPESRQHIRRRPYIWIRVLRKSRLEAIRRRRRFMEGIRIVTACQSER
jgi:hypothetical protein